MTDTHKKNQVREIVLIKQTLKVCKDREMYMKHHTPLHA